MKLWITGGGGQLAYELLRLAKQEDWIVSAPKKSECDIANASLLSAQLKAFQPDVVINTAAFTKVDLAESDPKAAFMANAVGAKNLSQMCAELGCLLLHLSTDYIFDGAKKTPYLEEDPPGPINVYGLSKWEGEEAVRSGHDRHIILRSSAIFGFQGHNFLKTILRRVQEGHPLRVVTDQVTCPTPAKSIAEDIFRIIQGPVYGTFHYCGAEAISWYAFACRILEHLKIKWPIEPILSKDHVAPAMRPLYSVLDCTKLKKTYGISKPDWEVELAYVLKALSTA